MCKIFFTTHMSTPCKLCRVVIFLPALFFIARILSVILLKMSLIIFPVLGSGSTVSRDERKARKRVEEWMVCEAPHKNEVGLD